GAADARSCYDGSVACACSEELSPRANSLSRIAWQRRGGGSGRRLLPADAWPTRRAGGSDGGGGPSCSDAAVRFAASARSLCRRRRGTRDRSGTLPCTRRRGKPGPIAPSLIDTHATGFRVVRRRARLRAAMAFFL